jgi:hypothetical protein
MRNQQAIQEALILGAGAEAEASAIIRETNSRSASPNLGLENMTTSEKMSQFLGKLDSDDGTTEPYVNSVEFLPNAFDSVCPEQTLVITQPVVTTTTTPADYVYVPPPLHSVNVHFTPILPNPLVSQTASIFHNAFVLLNVSKAPLTKVKTIGKSSHGHAPKVTGLGAVPGLINPNIAKQATFSQAPPIMNAIPGGGMHHLYSPPRAVPMNPGTTYPVPPPQNVNPTSPTHSSGSSHSNGSNGSRRSRREDKLGAILGALTLHNIEIGEGESSQVKQGTMNFM